MNINIFNIINPNITVNINFYPIVVRPKKNKKFKHKRSDKKVRGLNPTTFNMRN